MFKKFVLIAAGIISATAFAEPTYEAPVPADRPELAEVASMPLNDVHLRVRKEKDGNNNRKEIVQLKYDLPMELAGEVKSFTLNVPKSEMSDDGTLELTSAKGDATGVCALETDATYTCEMNYVAAKINLDQSKIDTYLRATETNADLLSKKRDLSMFFINEARGVIRGVKLREN